MVAEVYSFRRASIRLYLDGLKNNSKEIKGRFISKRPKCACSILVITILNKFLIIGTLSIKFFAPKKA